MIYSPKVSGLDGFHTFLLVKLPLIVTQLDRELSTEIQGLKLFLLIF